MKIKALKSLGQNFLLNPSLTKKIVKLSGLEKKDIVLEVGPGTGSLTKEIAQSCQKVIAVEKDPRLINVLKKTLKDFKNISIINKDILDYKIEEKNYKVIANLPFYIANLIIRNFLTSKNPPSKMVLIVQKEVAQRICQNPPKMNILALSVQSLGVPKILSYISKKSFSPAPKVYGAILEIIPAKKNINYDLFFKLVKAGFAHPRKQLAKNLKSVLKLDKEKINYWLMKNNINPKIRAEGLSLKDWINLTENYEKTFINNI